MQIEHEILINKYGQELVDVEQILDLFESFDSDGQIIFLNELFFLTIQSKPKIEDVELAIKNSGLKPTFTPCVLLRKGVKKHIIEKLINLPQNERRKVFLLLLNLFRIAYKRRFIIEKNDPNKWWYWDLSDEANINIIKSQIF